MSKEEEERYETIENDFTIFKNAVQRWIEILGLKEWKVYFFHKEDCVNYAELDINNNGLAVSFILAKKWPKRKPTKCEIELSAKHEVIHLLNAKLYSLAQDRFASKDEICRVEEEIVRRLEKIL